jgi:hypothetical protein
VLIGHEGDDVKGAQLADGVYFVYKGFSAEPCGRFK